MKKDKNTKNSVIRKMSEEIGNLKRNTENMENYMIELKNKTEIAKESSVENDNEFISNDPKIVDLEKNILRLRESLDKHKNSFHGKQEVEDLRNRVLKLEEERDFYKKKLRAIKTNFKKKNKDFEGKLKNIDNLKSNYKNKLKQIVSGELTKKETRSETKE